MGICTEHENVLWLNKTARAEVSFLGVAPVPDSTTLILSLGFSLWKFNTSCGGIVECSEPTRLSGSDSEAPIWRITSLASIDGVGDEWVAAAVCPETLEQCDFFAVNTSAPISEEYVVLVSNVPADGAGGPKMVVSEDGLVWWMVAGNLFGATVDVANGSPAGLTLVHNISSSSHHLGLSFAFALQQRGSDESAWTLVTANLDGSVRAWDVSPNNITLSHTVFTLDDPSRNEWFFSDIVFSDADTVAVTATPSGRFGSVLTAPLAGTGEVIVVANATLSVPRFAVPPDSDGGCVGTRVQPTPFDDHAASVYHDDFSTGKTTVACSRDTEPYDTSGSPWGAVAPLPASRNLLVSHTSHATGLPTISTVEDGDLCNSSRYEDHLSLGGESISVAAVHASTVYYVDSIMSGPWLPRRVATLYCTAARDAAPASRSAAVSVAPFPMAVAYLRADESGVYALGYNMTTDEALVMVARLEGGGPPPCGGGPAVEVATLGAVADVYQADLWGLALSSSSVIFGVDGSVFSVDKAGKANQVPHVLLNGTSGEDHFRSLTTDSHGTPHWVHAAGSTPAANDVLYLHPKTGSLARLWLNPTGVPTPQAFLSADAAPAAVIYGDVSGPSILRLPLAQADASLASGVMVLANGSSFAHDAGVGKLQNLEVDAEENVAWYSTSLYLDPAYAYEYCLWRVPTLRKHATAKRLFCATHHLGSAAVAPLISPLFTVSKGKKTLVVVAGTEDEPVLVEVDEDGSIVRNVSVGLIVEDQRDLVALRQDGKALWAVVNVGSSRERQLAVLPSAGGKWATGDLPKVDSDAFLGAIVGVGGDHGLYTVGANRTVLRLSIANGKGIASPVTTVNTYTSTFAVGTDDSVAYVVRQARSMKENELCDRCTIDCAGGLFRLPLNVSSANLALVAAARGVSTIAFKGSTLVQTLATSWYSFDTCPTYGYVESNLNGSHATAVGLTLAEPQLDGGDRLSPNNRQFLVDSNAPDNSSLYFVASRSPSLGSIAADKVVRIPFLGVPYTSNGASVSTLGRDESDGSLYFAVCCDSSSNRTFARISAAGELSVALSPANIATPYNGAGSVTVVEGGAFVLTTRAGDVVSAVFTPGRLADASTLIAATDEFSATTVSANPEGTLVAVAYTSTTTSDTPVLLLNGTTIMGNVTRHESFLSSASMVWSNGNVSACFP